MRELNSNQRPPAYETGELPTAPSRNMARRVGIQPTTPGFGDQVALCLDMPTRELYRSFEEVGHRLHEECHISPGLLLEPFFPLNRRANGESPGI